ncbi:MAG: substrate-binding domain-containing protein [Bacteroidota bacterium]
MRNYLTIALILTTIFFTGCFSDKKKEKTINISGAFALYPLTVKWSEEYLKEHPDIRFNITGGGAGKGMADALAGTVDLGMFSRAIAKEEKKKGVWWVGLTIDAVLPTMNTDNPAWNRIRVRGITRDEFAKIFLSGDAGTWEQFSNQPGSTPITVYTRSDACGAAETWAKYLGGSQESLKGVGIYGDPGLADAVANDPLAIGYNNAIYIYDIKTGKIRPGLAVPPLDLNANGVIDPDENLYSNHKTVLRAIAQGVYPSPPARELYFVSKGKPGKEVVLDFIKWTLTEGQKYVEEAGYVPLDSIKLNSELQKLD